jgi:hypothetical protein
LRKGWEKRDLIDKSLGLGEGREEGFGGKKIDGEEEDWLGSFWGLDWYRNTKFWCCWVDGRRKRLRPGRGGALLSSFTFMQRMLD